MHPETATLANVLANQGVVSGLTGEPLTEAAILGIGGGLGAGYILWEFKSHGTPILAIGFRNQWQYPWIPGWTGKTLERLGIEADVHETAGAKGARETLDAWLDSGSPVIASVDLELIGTWGVPDALEGHFGHTVVIVGREADGTYLVDDRGTAPFRITPDVMSAARGRIGSFKNRILRLRATRGTIAADRVRKALQAGLEDQVDHLRSSSDSFSLPAWRKWARMMTDERNAKAWPRVFADGQGLFGALLAVVEGVDAGAGPWGGHLRELYATSLDESALALDRPALTDAARAWRAAADAWDDLGDSAVPMDLEGADDAVEAAEMLRSAVNDGEAGRARARSAAEVTWGIRARYADSFPLPAERIDELLRGLGRPARSDLRARARRCGGDRPRDRSLEQPPTALGDDLDRSVDHLECGRIVYRVCGCGNSAPPTFSALVAEASGWSGFSKWGMIAKSTNPTPRAITKVRRISPSGVSNTISSDVRISPCPCGVSVYVSPNVAVAAMLPALTPTYTVCCRDGRRAARPDSRIQ